MEHVLDDGMDAADKPDEASASDSRPTCLADINTPADLRKLDLDDLVRLAAEIRSFLVDVAARKGGHFAPSMGTVELTLALHYTFDTPHDLLVWDVGHQAYAHKIITGRRDQLHTIRQDEGLSGFLKRSESRYDDFGAGHASTAPSAALGMAEGLVLQGKQQKVIAVIGDGAMTGGLAFEALNNAGALGSNLLVVLNDNAMSISPNVGAMAHYLTTLTTHPYYRKMKSEIHSVITRLPKVGPLAGEFARRLEQGLKGVVVPGALFQALGFTYLGPIDGHDLGELSEVLARVRDSSMGPLLLHVLTQKGRGYAPAEADPVKWHGVGPFDPVTGGAPVVDAVGSACAEAPSYTAAFSEALVDLAGRRSEIVGITAAMATGTGMDRFEQAYPERSYDVGIAEGHAVTFAAGLATQGLRPVCAIYSTFLQRAYDHVFHDVALQKLPVIFALDRSGLVGADGPTHHGLYDLCYMRSLPGMILSAPKDADELADLLETAASQDDGPFAIRYPRGKGPRARTRDPQVLPVGSWELLSEEGWDVALLAVGSMVGTAREVAVALQERGVGAAVINARFIKPLDLDLLRQVAARARLVVTLEEGTVRGGFAAAVMEALVEHEIPLKGRLLCRGVPDRFITHGTRTRLLSLTGLTSEQLLEAVIDRLDLGR